MGGIDRKVIATACADGYEGMSWEHIKEATAPILEGLRNFCEDTDSEIKLSISQDRLGVLM